MHFFLFGLHACPGHITAKSAGMPRAAAEGEREGKEKEQLQRKSMLQAKFWSTHQILWRIVFQVALKVTSHSLQKSGIGLVL